MNEHRQKAILRKVTRKTMSPEAREKLNAHNATQTYHGQCRVCRATWSGLLGDLPSRCPSCGFPPDVD